MLVPRTRPPVARERASVQYTRTYRQLMRNGPFYTVLGDKVRVGKTKKAAAASFNPFEDMESYTSKYKPLVRTLPRFDTRKYCMGPSVGCFAQHDTR